MEMSRRFNEEAVHSGEERHIYDDVSRVMKEKKEIGSGCFIIQCIYGCLAEAILPFIYKGMQELANMLLGSASGNTSASEDPFASGNGDPSSSDEDRGTGNGGDLWA
ncbi:hypothetical protein Tco_0453112 [Tanacetum coccineum]